jgi:hypothetical protein
MPISNVDLFRKARSVYNQPDVRLKVAQKYGDANVNQGGTWWCCSEEEDREGWEDCAGFADCMWAWIEKQIKIHGQKRPLILDFATAPKGATHYVSVVFHFQKKYVLAFDSGVGVLDDVYNEASDEIYPILASSLKTKGAQDLIGKWVKKASSWKIITPQYPLQHQVDESGIDSNVICGLYTMMFRSWFKAKHTPSQVSTWVKSLLVPVAKKNRKKSVPEYRNISRRGDVLVGKFWRKVFTKVPLVRSWLRHMKVSNADIRRIGAFTTPFLVGAI